MLAFTGENLILIEQDSFLTPPRITKFAGVIFLTTFLFHFVTLPSLAVIVMDDMFPEN